MKAEWTNRDNLSIETTGQNSKSVLVIDKPKNCLECKFCGYIADKEDGFRSCFLIEHCFEERDAEEEYLMCPLRPLPHSKQMENRWFSDDYSKGWNDCLAEITGETE